jgi:type IV secretion system protein VirB3
MANLPSDPIFKALTRPQMVAGVTYSYAVINLIVTIEGFIITKSFWILALPILAHLAGVLACLDEPRLIDLWLGRVRLCPNVPNRAFWSANSYSP